MTTIQFSVSFREFGSAKGSRFEGYLNDMKEFKSTIKNGETDTNKLLKMYPKVVFRFPRLVFKYLDSNTNATQINDHQLHMAAIERMAKGK